MIVVDTSVLSVVYRRRASGDHGMQFAALVAAKTRLVIPGVVLQEILSGIKRPAQFEELRDALSGFPLLLADRAAHVRAAQLASTCAAHGIAAASLDCLIAAQTILARASLWTLDADFRAIAKYAPLKLFDPISRG